MQLVRGEILSFILQSVSEWKNIVYRIRSKYHKNHEGGNECSSSYCIAENDFELVHIYVYDNDKMIVY